MKSLNPATGQVICEYQPHADDDVQRKLAAAEDAFTVWRLTAVADRARLLSGVAAVLEQRKPQDARLMTEEMGKPIAQSEAEIEKCAWVCRYYAEHSAAFLEPQSINIEGAGCHVRFDPLGCILAIMPWNFPFWQVFRFAAPAIMAGNVCLLKHAPNVTGCALAIEEVFRAVEFPAGIFASLLVDELQVPEIIASDLVRAVTLTGSERAGAAVAGEAGKQLKKTVLELGGSDPFIVLRDADLTHAVSQAVIARTINSGQSCIAAKRFLVEKPVADAFTMALSEQMASLTIGDPMDRSTNIGPLARDDLRTALHQQVQQSVGLGAKLACGGYPETRPGFYYAPTVLTDVRPGMPVFDEETFGPVAAVIPVDDADQAIRLANQSRYGLGASIWTQDIACAERLATQLESGGVFINEIVKSDPRVPFGGIKRSGYGRELSEFGIREFTNIKTVWSAR